MTSTKLESPNHPVESFWKRFGSWLIKPSSAIENPEEKRQTQLMSSLTLATFLLTSVRVIIGFRSGSYLVDEGFFLYYILQAAMILAYIFSRTKYQIMSTLIFVFAFTGLVYGIVFVRGSIDPLQNLNTLIWVLPGFAFGAVLFPFWASFVWMVTNFVVLLFLPRFYSGIESETLTGLVFTVFVLTILNIVLNRYRQLVENDRKEVILRTNRELQVLNTSLEQGVADRTRAVQTSTEVSRRLSTILDPGQLVLEVVEQVQAAFHYYHAHIYLLDDTGQTLKMVGGTGEAGQIMLERGHSIPLERGLVGRAARTNTPVLVPDTENEPGWLPNPLLPETQAEIAVPIAFGETVLGVLDVQHNLVNGLTEADVELMQSIASQVAVALQNARQYEKSHEREEDLSMMMEFSPEAIGVVNTQTGLFESVNSAAERLYGLPREELTKVGPAQMSPEFQPDGRPSLDAAMEKIGEALQGSRPVFEWIHTNADGELIPCEVRLVGLTGIRSHLVRFSVTDISERKRIEGELAKRAERDRVLARIATKIRGAASMEQVLQVATQEVRLATRATRSVAIIEPNEETISID